MCSRSACTSTLGPTSDPETIVKVAHWAGVPGPQIFNYLRNGNELGPCRGFVSVENAVAREGRTERTE